MTREYIRYRMGVPPSPEATATPVRGLDGRSLTVAVNPFGLLQDRRDFYNIDNDI